MSAVTVLAGPHDASLCGLPGDGAGAAGVVVALGDAEASEAEPAIRWLDQPPAGPGDPAARLMAPAGDGLWRVAPWPAADALFELEPAAGATIVVTGAELHLREEIVAEAAARGLEARTVESLDAEHLGEAACVVIAESPRGALPARAFPVLAAGRLLLVPRLERAFGLEDGLDHLEFTRPEEAVTLLEAYVGSPDAFARFRAWARLKAESRRASVAYGRLADELRLEDGAGAA